MITLVGISGSLRRQSLNTALLRAAAALTPQTARVEILELREVPLYDGDVEAGSGIPASVARLKDAVAAADGLLIATPEYNNSIPGVLKNAIDWMSRPPDDIARVFRGRPVALLGASPGPYGTILSQTAWLPIFRTLRMQLWSEGRLLASRANAAFDANGELIDDALRTRLREFMQGFVEFAGTRART